MTENQKPYAPLNKLYALCMPSMWASALNAKIILLFFKYSLPPFNRIYRYNCIYKWFLPLYILILLSATLLNLLSRKSHFATAVACLPESITCFYKRPCKTILIEFSQIIKIHIWFINTRCFTINVVNRYCRCKFYVLYWKIFINAGFFHNW